jgi:hypothetical protein
MMKGSLRLMIVLALLGATVAGISAQAPSGPRRSYVIGCVQRQGNQFVINDFRGGTLQLVVDPKEDMAFHVGHKVELAGTFQKGSGSAEAFKVETVVYISTTCQVEKPK